MRADYALGVEDYPATIARNRHFLESHNRMRSPINTWVFAYGMSGEVTEEIGEYLQAIKLGLHEWDLFLNLGLAYLSPERNARAIEASKSQSFVAPKTQRRILSWRWLMNESGGSPRHFSKIVAALRLKPRDPDQLNTEALIYVELGERDSARNVWARLVMLAPNYNCCSHKP
jgi:tetratricopeptide (TPR) repeat protein